MPRVSEAELASALSEAVGRLEANDEQTGYAGEVLRRWREEQSREEEGTDDGEAGSE